MKTLKESMIELLTEAISNKQFSKAQKIIKNYLQKYKIYTMPDINSLQVDNIKYFGNLVFCPDTNIAAYFLWEQKGSTSLSGVVFSENASGVINTIANGGRFKGDLEVTTNGASLAAVLPMVKSVLTKVTPMDIDSIDALISGAKMYESVEDDLAELRKRRDRLSVKQSMYKRTGKDHSSISNELEEIRQSIKSLKCDYKSSPMMTIDPDPVDKQELEFESKSTPEERFSDMEHYIDMVLKGVQPALIISGAPGVGKTFRVTRKIKAKHTLGKDYWVVKGKGTAASLYMDLFRFRHKGDVLVIDDADDIIKDDTCCNLLKAATDSSDTRIVSYGTARPPQMTEEEGMEEPDAVMDDKGRYFYPKTFETEASIIIITNMNAGQIDTAVRNRAIVCDLDFTTEELLGIVKDIMPNIMPDTLSVESKVKALQYLEDLSKRGTNMQISIRSFTTVAKIYTACEGDDNSAERMIREQMKLQFARGGKKY